MIHTRTQNFRVPCKVLRNGTYKKLPARPPVFLRLPTKSPPPPLLLGPPASLHRLPLPPLPLLRPFLLLRLPAGPPSTPLLLALPGSNHCLPPPPPPPLPMLPLVLQRLLRPPLGARPRFLPRLLPRPRQFLRPRSPLFPTPTRYRQRWRLSFLKPGCRLPTKLYHMFSPDHPEAALCLATVQKIQEPSLRQAPRGRARFTGPLQVQPADRDRPNAPPDPGGPPPACRTGASPAHECGSRMVVRKPVVQKLYQRGGQPTPRGHLGGRGRSNSRGGRSASAGSSGECACYRGDRAGAARRSLSPEEDRRPKNGRSPSPLEHRNTGRLHTTRKMSASTDWVIGK